MNVEKTGDKYNYKQCQESGKISGNADLLICSIVRPLIFAPT